MIFCDRIERVLRTEPESEDVVVYAWADDQVKPDANSGPTAVSDESAMLGVPTIPFKRSKKELVEAFDKSECILETNDIWARGIEPQNDKEKLLRDESAKIILPILADGTSHLSPATRGKLIEEARERTQRGNTSQLPTPTRVFPKDKEIP
jgi:hypothetical protein